MRGVDEPELPPPPSQVITYWIWPNGRNQSNIIIFSVELAYDHDENNYSQFLFIFLSAEITCKEKFKSSYMFTVNLGNRKSQY